jgi:nucleotide-binding universal stress UspA family protein
MSCAEPHRILVGYDGSRASRAALAWAEATARENHARLTLVMVVQRAWCAACWPGMAIAPAQDELERGAATELRNAIDELGPDVSVTSKVLSGPLGPALVREARRQDCDAVVIGRGRRLLPWSSPVERYLRRHCEIPVIAIAVPASPASAPAPASDPPVPAAASDPPAPAAIRPAV